MLCGELVDTEHRMDISTKLQAPHKRFKNRAQLAEDWLVKWPM